MSIMALDITVRNHVMKKMTHACACQSTDNRCEVEESNILQPEVVRRRQKDPKSSVDSDHPRDSEQLRVSRILINNRGYTIERAIHWPDENYNDIAPRRHQVMLDFFGAENPRQNSREVRTTTEFEEALSSPEFLSPSSIQLLEVHMDRDDIPWRLKKQIEIVASRQNGSI